MYYEDANGNVHQVENETLMVNSAEDFDAVLARFGSGIYQPGLIVFLPGYTDVRQIKADGTYQTIVGGESDGE